MRDQNSWLDSTGLTHHSDAYPILNGIDPGFLVDASTSLDDLAEIARDVDLDPVFRGFASGIHYARLSILAGTGGRVEGA